MQNKRRSIGNCESYWRNTMSSAFVRDRFSRQVLRWSLTARAMDDDKARGKGENDKLVDMLVRRGSIKTKEMEMMFRIVDRVDYTLPVRRSDLVSPFHYVKVLQFLLLKPGMSFLNIGSETGYLNTMAGLALGRRGTNHGVELYRPFVQFAYTQLEKFMKSPAMDVFDFCEPVFVQGNFFDVAPDKRYDRVYCGVKCSVEQQEFIKQFVRVGGILIMSGMGNITCVKRVKEDWFDSAVVPAAPELILFRLPECVPLSLQALCRGHIRHRLRQHIWNEHAEQMTMAQSWRDRSRFNRCLADSIRRKMLCSEGSLTNAGSGSTGMDREITYINRRHKDYVRMSGPARKQSPTNRHVDSDVFATYMQEKIRQLPLPLSLQLYVNYNRVL
ncbi:protein-L-isoaspartate O-methyltransferase domain-containing protein 1 isoform X1 [Andrena cerasifolii]|uniref:protein-L-isoaspartate O-methyltransferase domain-containing protein 1 isoform X1 n=2 Tax=Andrena cerasifolii TaxID=2819439 RepID=UPI004037A224